MSSHLTILFHIAMIQGILSTKLSHKVVISNRKLEKQKVMDQRLIKVMVWTFDMAYGCANTKFTNNILNQEPGYQNYSLFTFSYLNQLSQTLKWAEYSIHRNTQTVTSKWQPNYNNLYTLVQWNVIMYASVTFPMILVLNKLKHAIFLHVISMR